MKELVITSSLMIGAIVLLRWLFRGKVSQILIYAAWLLVAARLLLPIQFGHFNFSILTQTAPIRQIVNEVAKKPVAGPDREEVYDNILHDYLDRGESVFIPDIQLQIDSELSAAPEKDPLEVYDHYLQNSYQSGQQIILPQLQEQINAEVDKSITAPTFGQIAIAVWIAGITGMTVWFTVVNISFGRRLRRSAVQLHDLKCPVSVWVSPLIVSPCLFGLFRPAIYLTPQCKESEVQSRHVLTHELTHWKHKDHIWSLVRCICLCIYWFNPMVWLAAHLSKRDCELACDEAALKVLGDEERIAYGKTLVDMVAASPSPVQLMETATAMHETKKQLKARINYIAKKHKRLLIAVVCLILAAALITGCAFTGPKTIFSASKPTVTDPTVPTDITPPTASPPENSYLMGNIQIPEMTETGTELDASDIEALFSEEGSWLNMALTSLYDSHYDLDLSVFFANGIPGESSELTADEQRFLSQNSEYLQDGTVIRLPADKMLEILITYFPISYSSSYDTQNIYWEICNTFDESGIMHYSRTNCFYFASTGVKPVTNFRVLDIEHTAKNSYLVFYEADVPFSHENKTFLLKFSYIDGAYRIISNTQTDLPPGVIPDIPAPEKFAQLPEDPKIEDLVFTNYTFDLQWDSSSYGTPYSNEYSFRLPAITPFSKGAVAINENIHSTFMSFVYGMRSRYYSQPYQSGLSYRIDYEAYLSDNILSIVISSARRQNNAKEYETPIYYIYSLDVTTGEQMTTAKLIHKYLGESYAQFLAHCSSDVPRYLRDHRSDLPSDAYTTPDETAIQLYVENGKLMLIGHIVCNSSRVPLRTPFEEIDQYNWKKTNEAVYHSLLGRFPEMDDPESSYSAFLRKIFYTEPELFVSMLAQEEEAVIHVNALRLAPQKNNYSAKFETYSYYLNYLIRNSTDATVVQTANQMLSIANDAQSQE